LKEEKTHKTVNSGRLAIAKGTLVKKFSVKMRVAKDLFIGRKNPLENDVRRFCCKNLKEAEKKY
jgi:hypothetical protein